MSVIKGCFHKYIVGQCTKAVILGTLCAAGMLILWLRILLCRDIVLTCNEGGIRGPGTGQRADYAQTLEGKADPPNARRKRAADPVRPVDPISCRLGE